MTTINVILFDDFTIMDAVGPVEVFQRVEKHYHIEFFSRHGGKVKTHPNLGIETKSFKQITAYDILLIPGGFGTRPLVDDPEYIQELKQIVEKSELVLTVCTGSALLAKTGLLRHHKATSNKLAFEWVITQDADVYWVRKARWVVDGKFYTSSGVTAGIDMALGFIQDHISNEVAEQISKGLEYVWNKDRADDPFA